MSKSVILNFASGSLETGFSVNVQIYNDLNLEPEVSDCFDLPPNLAFDKTYRDWKRLLGSEDEDKNRLDYGCSTRAKGGCTKTVTGSDFSLVAEQFREQINTWLSSHSQLEQCIRTPLLPQEEIKIIVNAKDRQLQKLPWHLWKLFDEFARAEIAFSEPPAIKVGDRDSSRDELNILTILGSDGGIDVRQDLEVIKSLPANVVALSKPRRREVSDELWDKSWDILFFSGHSNTVDGKGIIHINDTESMTIDELKNGLRKAIANGLRLAIFNSCDGLGLAWELKEARLQIPQLIVMREPVPDVVAQKFARYFLNDLAKDISFYRAFREARERLKEEFQDIYPYTDWLPITFQNPTQKVFSWKNEDSKVIDWTGLISDYQQKQLELTSNRLSGKHENLPLIDLGLVERKKAKSVGNLERDGNSNNEEQEVITNYDNSTFFTEVLEQGNTPKQQGRIAIAGEPGAGKTTFLQQIASRVLERDWGIPVWISLKDIGTIGKAEGDSNKLQNYIYTSWLSQILNKPLQSITESETTALTELFEQSKIWLLLDGLDEMRVTGVQSPLSAINQQLNNLSLKSPHRIVITCRQNLLNASSSNSLTSFDTFYTQKFNPQQVEQFIDNWFIQLPQYAVELKQQLAEPQYENINYLIVNPLLLTMLCVIYERRQGADLGSLPETRARLYRQFIAFYYNWKNEEFNISRADKDKLEKDVLGKIALWGLKNSSSRYLLLEEELKEFLQTEYNWQGKELYSWLFKLENSWLQKIGFAQQDTTQVAYAFLHPTFQEYFAATAIDDYDFFLPKDHVNKPVSGKKYRIFEDKWREVILFWCGLGLKSSEKQERNDFIEKLINFQDGCIGFYKAKAYILSAKVYPEIANNDNSIKHQIIKNLERLCKIELWSVLITEIININNSIAFHSLLNYWGKFKYDSTRIKVTNAVVNTKDIETIDKIISLLSQKACIENVYIRNKITRNINISNNFRAIIKLIGCLPHNNISIRRDIIYCLKNNFSKQILEKNAVSLLQHNNTFMRCGAVELLGEIESNKHLDKIILALCDEDIEVVRSAYLVLESKAFDQLEEKKSVFNRKDIELAMCMYRKLKKEPVLKDEDIIERISAKLALAEESNNSELNEIKKEISLLPYIIKSEDYMYTFCSLCMLENQLIDEQMVYFLEIDDRELRESVICYFELRGELSQKIRDKIALLLQNEKNEIKIAAIKILKHTKNIFILENKSFLLYDKNKEVCLATIDALKQSAKEAIKKNIDLKIVPWLKSTNKENCLNALSILKNKEGIQKYEESIASLLHHNDQQIRWRASIVLSTTENIQILKDAASSGITYFPGLHWNSVNHLSYPTYYKLALDRQSQQQGNSTSISFFKKFIQKYTLFFSKD